MRSELLRAGIAPAIGALVAFAQPAATAMAAHSDLCGSGAGIDILFARTSHKPGQHGPSNPAACHAICASRKQTAPGRAAMPGPDDIC
ncbi:hypothetical protein [Sphingomonas sp. YR710]|jgi:hypothetical protein|uniref:hypothetical protein n=1 Tax=Sphingomonas sp. YR710 TaxID=1882773 RepID=UPI000B808488|nr:hypothetical protein [Sphingomonas sp. YR710]